MTTSLGTQWTLIGWGRIAPSPQWRMRSHCHEISELIVVVGGTLHVKEPTGNAFIGKAGDVFLYPARCWHEEELDKEDPVETLYFTFKGHAGEKIKSTRDRDGRIRALSQWICNSRAEIYSRSDPLNQVFFEAIRQDLNRLEHQSQDKAAFSDIRRFIMENIRRRITLDELAELASMSKFHFVREYKKKAGVSPMAEVRRIRIEEAKNLIASTNLPLKAIAPMVGLANEYQLSAVMKKMVGRSPGYFRKK